MSYAHPTSIVAVFEHPVSGNQEGVPRLAWLWMLLFGAIYMAVRGLWRDLAIGLVVVVLPFFLFSLLGVITAVVFWLYYAMNAEDVLRQNYLRQGWQEVTE